MSKKLPTTENWKKQVIINYYFLKNVCEKENFEKKDYFLNVKNGYKDIPSCLFAMSRPVCKCEFKCLKEIKSILDPLNKICKNKKNIDVFSASYKDCSSFPVSPFLYDSFESYNISKYKIYNNKMVHMGGYKEVLYDFCNNKMKNDDFKCYLFFFREECIKIKDCVKFEKQFLNLNCKQRKFNVAFNLIKEILDVSEGFKKYLNKKSLIQDIGEAIVNNLGPLSMRNFTSIVKSQKLQKILRSLYPVKKPEQSKKSIKNYFKLDSNLRNLSFSNYEINEEQTTEFLALNEEVKFSAEKLSKINKLKYLSENEKNETDLLNLKNKLALLSRVNFDHKLLLNSTNNTKISLFKNINNKQNNFSVSKTTIDYNNLNTYEISSGFFSISIIFLLLCKYFNTKKSLLKFIIFILITINICSIAFMIIK